VSGVRSFASQRQYPTLHHHSQRLPEQGALFVSQSSKFIGFRAQGCARDRSRPHVDVCAQELKEVVAEQALELRLLKKSTIADGGDGE
jgi:hypothetical protein